MIIALESNYGEKNKIVAPSFIVLCMESVIDT